jgi:hypothetical protein
MILQALSVLLLAAPPAIYFEQTVTIASDGHHRRGGVSSRVWFAGERIRMEAAEGGPAFVLRLDSGKAYRLDPIEQTATVIDMARLKDRSRSDASMAGDLMGTASASAQVTKLTEARTIAGHTCHGYRLTSGTTELDVYLAEDLPVGIEAFAAFLEWSGASQSLSGILAPLRKLHGFPLETDARVSVLGHLQETLSTVTKVSVGPLAESLFELPAGFRLVTDEAEDEN